MSARFQEPDALHEDQLFSCPNRRCTSQRSDKKPSYCYMSTCKVHDGCSFCMAPCDRCGDTVCKPHLVDCRNFYTFAGGVSVCSNCIEIMIDEYESPVCKAILEQALAKHEARTK